MSNVRVQAEFNQKEINTLVGWAQELEDLSVEEDKLLLRLILLQKYFAKERN